MHVKWTLSALAASLVAGIALANPPTQTPTEVPAPKIDNGPADAPPGTAIAADADVYVYPSKGQSDKQLDRDRYECHNWAVAQSHYNPSEPHLAPHQQIQVVAMPAPPPGQQTVAGAVTGAVIGAVIGSPRSTGEGAVAGAIAGAVIGASSESAQRRETEQSRNRVDAGAQAERARLERQASDYRRAISACLEGRGYTVK